LRVGELDGVLITTQLAFIKQRNLESIGKITFSSSDDGQKIISGDL